MLLWEGNWNRIAYIMCFYLLPIYLQELLRSNHNGTPPKQKTDENPPKKKPDETPGK